MRASNALRGLGLGIIAGLAATSSQQADAQGSNSGDIGSTALNSGAGPRLVGRTYAAPRLDASADLTHHVITHFLTYIDQGTPPVVDPTDFREQIAVFSNGSVFGVMEGDVPRNAAGVPMSGLIFGGDAYRWNSFLHTNFPESKLVNFDLTLDPDDDRSDLLTFGGTTIGAGKDGTPRYAFFAGLVNASDYAPGGGFTYDTLANDAGEKPNVLFRGIWSVKSQQTLPVLRALETTASTPDPDSRAPFNGSNNLFFRLHPSDYSESAFMVGSLFEEERYGRINNITMNDAAGIGVWC